MNEKIKVMVYDGPRKLRIEEVEGAKINGNEVRIQTLFSGISHGTEMSVYRGVAPFFRRKNDKSIRLFRPAEDNEMWSYPVRSSNPGVWYMGYANVGRIIEIGNEVEGLKVGDIVYSHAPHQSQIVKAYDQVVKLPEDIKPEHGIFFTNLMTTFNGILDTRIKLGDTVAVSGLGVLGQLSLQMVKMSGAFNAIGIDQIEKRLEVALANGADKVYNPKICSDIAYEIRMLTEKKGADAVIEVSGNHKALKEAIRIAAPDTTVTALGWYQGLCSDLDLSEEFHHNRVTIRSSQSGHLDPEISHMWDFKRKQATCMGLLRRLKLDNLITHRVPYDNAADAYELIDKNPNDIIQVVLTY